MQITKQSHLCKGYILYHFNYMTFWKSQNYRNSKKASGCQGFRGRERGWIDRAEVTFRRGETILYDAIMVDMWHYAFVKNYGTINTMRVNPNVIYGINTGSSIITNVSCTTLMQNVNRGKTGEVGWGVCVCGNSV